MEWKTINDYPYYQVSTLGEIKRLSRYNIKGHFLKEKIMKTKIDKQGYEVIGLVNKEGQQKVVKVHRMVALTFIPNPDCKPDVNHKWVDKALSAEENKRDNRIENLEWVTKEENMGHAHRENLVSYKGVKNSQSKLNEQEIIEIRDKYSNGLSLKEIADQYGVTNSNIGCIVKNKTWKHV